MLKSGDAGRLSCISYSMADSSFDKVMQNKTKIPNRKPIPED